MTVEEKSILIGKVLSTNASEEEVDKLLQWRKSDTDNESFYQEMKRIWDLNAVSYKEIDVDKAREMVKSRLVEHYSVSRKPLHRIINIWQKVAAIVVLPLLILSVWQITKADGIYPVDHRFELIAPKGQLSQCILPDGSYVWLNGGSSVIYTASQFQEERVVELIGEGYFQVEKNEEIPFIVKTSNTQVKVYGTSFNVNSFKKEKVIVTLEEGKVGVSGAETAEPSVFLSQGEQAIVKADGTIKKQKVSDTQLYTSWKERKLVFRNENLATIAEELEEIFDVNITFKDQACKEYRYRGTIEYENSIFHTMEILELTSDIKYKMTGRNIYLELKK